jgi:hypothetical protein
LGHLEAGYDAEKRSKMRRALGEVTDCDGMTTDGHIKYPTFMDEIHELLKDLQQMAV